MTDIKELATLTAAEMDNIYLRNVPAIILEQYAARLIAAYLAEQEPVVRVVDGGGELHLPKLQWVSANHSLETPIGSTLFTAPPLPAIPDHLCLVPREPTDKWVEQVIRFYQPHLDHNCLAWRKCEEHARHWHKAMIAAGEAK